MSASKQNVFTPGTVAKTSVPAAEELSLPGTPSSKASPLSNAIVKGLHWLMVGGFGILPLIFWPGSVLSVGFTKTIYISLLLAVVVAVAGLALLRTPRLATVVPLPLFGLWAFAIISFIAAYLSGDAQDAVRGSGLEVYTAGFALILATTVTVPLLWQGRVFPMLCALGALSLGIAVAMLIGLANIFGLGVNAYIGLPDDSTLTVLGRANDLAVLAAAVLVGGLVVLLRFPRRVLIAAIFGVTGSVSLAFLVMINFATIWYVLGLATLVLFVYLLSRDTWFEADSEPVVSASVIPVAFIGVVCLLSGVMILAGDSVSGYLGERAGFSYVEVRPSAEATFDIVRAVWADSAWLGTGPNRFVDAWRLHKDASINQTIFWNTDFISGSGFVPTLLVTVGLVGVAGWLSFLFLYLYTGVRLFVLPKKRPVEPAATIGLISFVASVYIWGMTFVYSAGVTVLIVAALLTGMVFACSYTLQPSWRRSVSFAAHRGVAFLVMGLVIIIVSGSVILLLSLGNQYTAQARYNTAVQTASNADELVQAASASYVQYPDDRFQAGVAQARLLELRALIQTAQANNSELDQTRFRVVAEQAVAALEAAKADDASEGTHYLLGAQIYGTFSEIGVNGAYDRALAELEAARTLLPLNPEVDFYAAQLSLQIDDTELAREHLTAALSKKQNYTPALELQAQIAIASGDIDAAITNTRAIVTFEPRNPARYYQLGVLALAAENQALAISALEAAVALDQSYANARYVLATQYIAQERTEDALAQLRVVAELNPENEQLLDLIAQLETGSLPDSTPAVDIELDDEVNREPQIGEDGEVVVPTEPETDLVTPVNQGAAAEGGDEMVAVPELIEETEVESETIE